MRSLKFSSGLSHSARSNAEIRSTLSSAVQLSQIEPYKKACSSWPPFQSNFNRRPVVVHAAAAILTSHHEGRARGSRGLVYRRLRKF